MPPAAASGCCSHSQDSQAVDVHSSTGFEGDEDNSLEMVPPPPRCPVTLDFQNITYSATRFNMASMKFERKQLLHGISGTLKPGELTAIIGPSGAGKTTLLNILAGYTMRGVGGTVLVNGRPHTRADRPPARYIRQQDQLRPHLTAVEAMNYAASLKMGFTISQYEKDKKVKFTLSLLGLWNTRNTLSGALSGGQRRRLAVALELLSDPPVLLLDEPTTGLDAVSARAVIGRLVALAHAGRTIAATLHGAGWPALASCGTILCTAEGRRLYRGPPSELPPRLAAAALPCPPYHNPADFLLEIASGQHDVDLIKLSEAISEPDPPYTKPEKEPLTKIAFGLELIKLKRSKKTPLDLSLDDFGPVPATVLQQTWLLLKRNMLTLSRNYSLYLWRVAAHIVIALLFGYLYAGVGEKAGRELANYVYLYGSMLLVVYTGKMSVTLSFPLEIECLEREHFNGWYKLGPYIISLLAIEIPFQAVCCVIYGATSYWLTGNPLVWWRLGLILVAMILTSLSAQGWGYFIGSTTPVKIAVFLGPVLAVLFSVFGFCISLADTPAVFRWLYHISYFRAGFHDVVYAVYGFDRPKLPCTKPEGGLEYCHFAIPSKFLKEMAILDISIVNNILLLCGTMVTMHILNCVTLWIRLNKRTQQFVTLQLEHQNLTDLTAKSLTPKFSCKYR